MILTLDVASEDALRELKFELGSGEGQGEVIARLLCPGGESAAMRLGRNFLLDGDLAERLAAIEGLENVSLQPARASARLRLVA